MVAEDIRLLRYRERLHLTYQQAMAEPIEAVEHALLIWELDRIHDNLKSGNNN